MVEKILEANETSLVAIHNVLDRVEVALLQGQVQETLVSDLMEVGYWANEVLQSRISYEEHQTLLHYLHRVKYLQMLYLENVLSQRVNTLSQELKALISPEAWRVFLRLDEVRGMELESFEGNPFDGDYNLELICSEQALRSRLSALKLKAD